MIKLLSKNLIFPVRTCEIKLLRGIHLRISGVCYKQPQFAIEFTSILK